MCNVYDTASSREAPWLCTENIFFLCLFFQRRLQSKEINPVKEQEIISVYCLCFQLQSRWLLKCSVCGEQYHRQCVITKIARRKNSVLHVDADLLSPIDLISSFVFISSANLVLIIDFKLNTVPMYVTSYYYLIFRNIFNWHDTIWFEEVWPVRTRYIPRQL